MVSNQSSSSHVVQKYLTKIIAYQLAFSFLFGTLAYLLFHAIGKKFSAIISIILGTSSFASHDLAATILATSFSIFAMYLSIFTVGQHFGINKNFSTITIGTLATIAISVMFLVLLNQQFVTAILLVSLLIALFGFHHAPKVHSSLQKPSKKNNYTKPKIHHKNSQKKGKPTKERNSRSKK